MSSHDGGMEVDVKYEPMVALGVNHRLIRDSFGLLKGICLEGPHQWHYPHEGRQCPKCHPKGGTQHPQRLPK